MNKAIISVTFRKLAEQVEKNPGMTFDLPDGDELLTVTFCRRDNGRRDRFIVEAQFRDYGKGVFDSDTPLQICD